MLLHHKQRINMYPLKQVNNNTVKNIITICEILRLQHEVHVELLHHVRELHLLVRREGRGGALHRSLSSSHQLRGLGWM